jgi:PPM family protein phosphatase
VSRSAVMSVASSQADEAAVYPGNAQHHGTREHQEDSFAFSNLDDHTFVAHGGVLAVVADGMGGLARGGEASSIAVRTFLQRYESKTADQSVPDALHAALLAANDAVVTLARAHDAVGNVGATLVAVVIRDRVLHWISVGDSRGYLFRGGRLEQLTLDHVYGVDLDGRAAAGTMSREDASADPDRGALTSHLGQLTLALVDRSNEPLPLERGDRVLLCTDGLYRALAADEIAGALGGEAHRACEKLIDAVMLKAFESQDNVTAVALAVGAPTEQPGSVPVDMRGPNTRVTRKWAPVLAVILVLVVLAAAGIWWNLFSIPSEAPSPR